MGNSLPKVVEDIIISHMFNGDKELFSTLNGTQVYLDFDKLLDTMANVYKLGKLSSSSDTE